MHILLTTHRRLLPWLLAMPLTALTLSTLAQPGSPAHKMVATAAAPQPTSIRSDTYHGTVRFEDRDKTRLDGAATLVVEGRNFTLTDSRGGLHKGELYTLITSGYGGGYIQFEGDRKISIKWTQGLERPSRLKIVNARGECIKFRFCSNDITADECRTQLRPG